MKKAQSCYFLAMYNTCKNKSHFTEKNSCVFPKPSVGTHLFSVGVPPPFPFQIKGIFIYETTT